MAASSTAMHSLSPEVLKRIRHYVYLYVDPVSDEVFYVGKGFGNRAFAHLEDKAKSKKVQRIAEIRRSGGNPRIKLLVRGLADEKAAYPVEAAAIDLLGKGALTNQVRDWRSGTCGRMSVEQVEAQDAAEEADIIHPALLIRINELFRYGMTPAELYDATRGAWKVGQANRYLAQSAFAVFDGIVQEVYQVLDWYPAGSTFSTREYTRTEGRWEFVGSFAEDTVRNRYRLGSVRSDFLKGAQNPIRYVFPEGS